jgi:hypothetical protein
LETRVAKEWKSCGSWYKLIAEEMIALFWPKFYLKFYKKYVIMVKKDPYFQGGADVWDFCIWGWAVVVLRERRRRMIKQKNQAGKLQTRRGSGGSELSGSCMCSKIAYGGNRRGSGEQARFFGIFKFFLFTKILQKIHILWLICS